MMLQCCEKPCDGAVVEVFEDDIAFAVDAIEDGDVVAIFVGPPVVIDEVPHGCRLLVGQLAAGECIEVDEAHQTASCLMMGLAATAPAHWAMAGPPHSTMASR